MAKIHSEFTTKMGTVLPLLDLRGKPYLQVAHRIQWFREENPLGIIKTQMLSDVEDEATFRAEIFIIPNGKEPMLVATAHKSETKKGFADYREKAETGSIGRSLALLGYGTQFTGGELDEGDRLADSPIAAGKVSKKSSFRKPKVVAAVGGDL